MVLVCLSRARSQSSQLARPETRGHDLDLSLNLITNPELLETRSSIHGPGIGFLNYYIDALINIRTRNNSGIEDEICTCYSAGL